MEGDAMTEPRPIYVTDADLTGPALMEAIDRALGRNQPTIIEGVVVESDTPAEPWRVDAAANEYDLVRSIDEYISGLWSPVLVEAMSDASSHR